MGPRYERILKKIKSQLPEAVVVELEDESHQHSGPKGAESHFKLLVVAETFAEKPRLARQRQVLSWLNDELNSGLHALTMRLLTPGEWQEQKSAFQSPKCASKIKRP